MLEAMGDKVFEMVSYKPRRKTFSLIYCLQLGKQAFFDIVCTAAHRVKLHHRLPGFFNRFDGTRARLSNFFKSRRKTAIIVKIADDLCGCFFVLSVETQKV